MNFYTINFKCISPFFLALFMGLTLLAIVDTSIYFLVKKQTSRDRFIDNKESKFIHLAKQEFTKNLDAIFIGSSYTKNHISTNDFLKHGFNIYNLGISGRMLADFPSMSIEAIKKKPKLIVLNISIEELSITPTTDYVHFNDLLQLIESSSSFTTIARHTWQFLLSMHYLHYYREAIYQQLMAGINRLILPFKFVSQTEKQSNANLNLLKTSYEDQDRLGVDCDVFKASVYATMKVVTCTNGDGAQLGYETHTLFQKPLNLEVNNINHDALNLLNTIILNASEYTKVIVVLQPMRGSSIKFDLPALASMINAPLVDLTSTTFSDRDWCDANHFNIYGRKKYSELLAYKLTPYL